MSILDWMAGLTGAVLASASESEFDSESRRTADTQMNLKKSERQIKELSLMNSNRKSENERMENLIAQLDCEMQK